MEISKEDREMIRKFQDIMSRGYYASGEQVTDLHNKILGTRLASTNCSSCIRSRISALVNALDRQEAQEAKEAEKKAAEEPKPEPKKTKAKK